MSKTKEKWKIERIYRDSDRRDPIERDLTFDEAKKLVKSFPDKEDSMVVFNKQDDETH